MLATFDAILKIVENPTSQRALQKGVIQLKKTSSQEVGKKGDSFSVVNNFHTTFLLKRESESSCYGMYLLLVLIIEPFPYISLEFFVSIKKKN